MKTLLTILAFFLLNINPCFSQTSCDRYSEANNNIVTYKADLKKKFSETLYNKLKTESLIAASQLVKCIQEKQMTPLQQLNAYYQAGKFFFDAGDCTQATAYFKLCGNMPLAQTTQFNASGKTFSQKINELLASNFCKEKIKEDVTGTLLVKGKFDYSGKGGMTFTDKKTTELIGKDNLDALPYLSDEIEELNDRVFTINDSVKAFNQVKQITGPTTQLYFNAPFLIVDVNDNIINSPGSIAQNTYDNDHDPLKDYTNERSGAPPKTKSSVTTETLSNINNLIQHLTKKYSATPPTNITTIYLYNGGLNNDQYKNYLDFCNQIHFRYPGKRIGYYNPHDQSLVVWLASGMGTFAHEYMHLILSEDFKQIPDWLNEGIASLEEETDGERPEDNWRLVYIKYFRQKWNGYLKLEDVIARQNIPDEYSHIIHDCYARYFCFFLQEKDQLKNFYTNLKNTKGELAPSQQIKTLETLFNQPIDTIQNNFYHWLNNRYIPSKWRYHTYLQHIETYTNENITKFDVIPIPKEAGYQHEITPIHNHRQSKFTDFFSNIFDTLFPPKGQGQKQQKPRRSRKHHHNQQQEEPQQQQNSPGA